MAQQTKLLPDTMLSHMNTVSSTSYSISDLILADDPMKAAHSVGRTDGIPDSPIWPSPVAYIMAIFEVNYPMSGLSLPFCNSVSQTNKQKNLKGNEHFSSSLELDVFKKTMQWCMLGSYDDCGDN